MNRQIPLSVPNLCGNEAKYLNECLETNFVSSVGKFVNIFEEKFAQSLNVKHAIAVMNGTSALHISLILAGVTRNDEVLAPNLTFVAPLNAIKYVGANPILIDSSWNNLGMDLNKLESYLQNNTKLVNNVCQNKNTGRVIKAILPVHVLGISVQMDRLLSIAQKYNLKIVEDASESLGTDYNNQATGTFGEMGCFSFNGNKIITSGGGGMIVTNHDTLAQKAKHLTTTAKIDSLNFIHDEVGYNYRMVNILAALGLGQLEQLEKFLTIKNKNAKIYRNKLSSLPGVKILDTNEYMNSNHWFYPLVIEDPKINKDNFIQYFIKNGVDVRPMWSLMESLAMFKNCEKTETNVSKDIHSRIINLPCSTNLKEDDICYVCDLLRGYF